MNTKRMVARRRAAAVPVVALLAAGTAFWACSGEFRTVCPEGTTQTAGGGDIDLACTRNDLLAGQAGAGGEVGAGAAGGGGGGVSGAGGSGGNVLPVPLGGVCNPNATKCESGAQQTCGADGLWGAAQGCELACDGAGVACVVPVQLALGSIHSCARMSDGTVRCWGYDNFLQLGNGPEGNVTVASPVPGVTNVISIAAADHTTCAILADRSVLCWGVDPSAYRPTPNYPLQYFGDTPTPLPDVDNAAQVVVGVEHLCVLKIDGKVVCRGTNKQGELGNDSVEGRSDYFVEANFTDLPKPTSISTMASGTTCALLEDGHVACWGIEGDASTGATLRRPTLVRYSVNSLLEANDLAVGLSFSCVARKDESLACWGHNEWAQLGRGSNSPGSEKLPPSVVEGFGGVKKVSAYQRHACAIKTDGSLWCWGFNPWGQLGFACNAVTCVNIGDNPEFATALSPARVPLDDVVHVGTGYSHSCALTGDSKAYCWGVNSGQLGIGTTGENVKIPTPVVWK